MHYAKCEIMQVINPFPVIDYISPECFCDRVFETNKIISAFENGRNVTLVSFRRMGKTGLIKHVFYNLKDRKNLKLIYVDLLKTENLSDLVKAFAEVLVKNEGQNFMKKLSALISGIRGKIAFNEITGAPEVTFDYSPGVRETENSISKLFDFLAEQKETYYIAFDEFQQIVNYPEKNVEAVLRSYIQNQHKDHFIFSGSSQHILISMFNDYGRPFYQSSDILHLERLDKNTYIDFIHDQFLKRKKEIDKSVVTEYVELLDVYTFYVQYFFNRLFERSRKKITRKFADKVYSEILAEKEYIYIGYRSILTKVQYSLLKAIAKEGGTDQPTSGEFMKKYNFLQPGTVSRALNSLLTKEMIFKENETYRVYDLFLSKWLENA